MGERRVWIPMEDGVRLATSLFPPDSGEPAPVLLEALPYRKDDATTGYRSEHEWVCGRTGTRWPGQICWV
jgi:predicted acyl esterase